MNLELNEILDAFTIHSWKCLLMKSLYSSRFLLASAGLFFLVYGALVTYFTGDVGFEGDDWWIFSWPYWNSYPYSVWLYARDLLRPIEGLYWITLFEFFGFNKAAFHFFSILLLAGASLSMGACLRNLFPNRKVFVAAAIFWAFFLPTVSCLTYVVTTDNSRLSLLLFWVSVLSFQKWVIGGCSWKGLALPVCLYLTAFFTYESTSLLILAVPLFLIPLNKVMDKSLERKTFFLRLAIAIGLSLLVALSIRFSLLGGGAVSHSYLAPPFELIWSYIALFPIYFSGIFDFGLFDGKSIIFGIIAFSILILFFFHLEISQTSKSQRTAENPYDKPSYIMLLSLAIIVLGMAPYQLAGYGSLIPKISETVMTKYGLIEGEYTPWFNYNWSSRIYSSASFGVAILFALFMTFWKTLRARYVAYSLGSAFMGLAVVFLASLIVEWTEAAQIRNSICRSFVSQVPDVELGTNLLFLDLESYHKRAAVFRGWNGLRELVKMIYADPTLGAYYIYRCSCCSNKELHHQAVLTPKGFISRGVKMDDPLPESSLLILQRVGADLALLDNLSSDDGIVSNGIKWIGMESLASNSSRILPWALSDPYDHDEALNPWNSGLILTLNLSRIKLAHQIKNRWIYSGSYKKRSLVNFRSL